MSAVTAAPPTGAGSGDSADPKAPGGGRILAARPWVILLVLVLVCAFGLALASANRGAGGRLDPGSPAPPGAKALAQVLGERGAEVDKVTQVGSISDLGQQDGTLLVTRASYLSDQQLAALARTTNPLVLVEPDEQALARLAPTIEVARVADSYVAGPGCADAGATAAGRAQAGNLLYAPVGGSDPNDPITRICYRDPNLVSAGSYVVTQSQGRSVTIIGQGSLLTNEELAQEGNAALALRTLGRTDVLTWYMPDPLEGGSDEPTSLRELIPPVVWWIIAQLLVVVVLTMVWRGRRLGRLVDEPLPVVVQAAETQLGRARLYREAHARGRAADTLRTAALRRLALRLAAPGSAAPAQVVSLIAEAVDRPAVEVSHVLLGPPPQTDLELVQLAERLDELERLATPTQINATNQTVTPAATTAGDRRP